MILFSYINSKTLNKYQKLPLAIQSKLKWKRKSFSESTYTLFFEGGVLVGVNDYLTLNVNTEEVDISTKITPDMGSKLECKNLLTSVENEDSL